VPKFQTNYNTDLHFSHSLSILNASSLKVEKLIKKQTYMKTEAYKLYSTVF